MADDVTLDPGADGATIRTLEDASSIHWPVGVVAYATTVGTPDELQVVTAANPLPVTVISSALPTGAATAANQSTANTALTAIQAAVETLDNTVAGNELQVDVLSSALPTGAATAANQSTGNTALAAIQTAVQLIDNAVAGNELQVDIVSGQVTINGIANSATPDFDTGVGLAPRLAFGVLLPAAGGPVIGGTSTDPLRVDPTGSTTQPVSVASALPAGTNNIGDVDVLTLPALPAGTNNIGDVDVLTLPALPAGTNTIGNVGSVTRTTGGATPGKLISAATTNPTVVKASAGTLYTLCAFNLNAAPRYLKLYDDASSPDVGTDTPVWTFLIPGNTAGAGFVVPIPSQGIAFANGIAFALTTGIADSDTGAVAANEIAVDYAYA